MPLLEVIQTRHISASIRLTEATALLVDQYAGFIHATADDVMEFDLDGNAVDARGRRRNGISTRWP